jgi:anti-sigma B factor antagonist
MHGPVAVVTPEGTLWGGDETGQLRETIEDLKKKENKHLVLDLGKVNHLNSTALGLLVSTHTNYTQRGGTVKLCALEKRISNLLVITKLSMVFDTYTSLEDALASYATKG